mgnify:FL=1
MTVNIRDWPANESGVMEIIQSHAPDPTLAIYQIVIGTGLCIAIANTGPDIFVDNKFVLCQQQSWLAPEE